ncbi:hypothetical protein HDF14_000131 [Edaphobacter lichenicola]|uniref:Uncharacterized protein n=1 Tax=Tunturiibacter gelidiferens TaxID=3069689 RepID=A0A9X0Q9Z1_9BACT|nr:hypothetical protein [Edaphobacter lichenicola]
MNHLVLDALKPDMDIFSETLNDLSAMDPIPVEPDMMGALEPSEVSPLPWKCFDSKHVTLRWGNDTCSPLVPRKTTWVRHGFHGLNSGTLPIRVFDFCRILL